MTDILDNPLASWVSEQAEDYADKVTATVQYTFTPGTEKYDPYEEFDVIRHKPACTPETLCSMQGTHKNRLCHACWFDDFVSNVGWDYVIADDDKWEGRNERSATLTLVGAMDTESYGGEVIEYDDIFNQESLTVEGVTP